MRRRAVLQRFEEVAEAQLGLSDVITSISRRIVLLRTGDPKTAFNKVNALHAGGNTALYDAVIFACDKLRKRATDVITRPVSVPDYRW